MKIFKSGETVQAICYNCKSIQKAVFQIRDVPFSDGSGTAKAILVVVCEQCDQAIVTPHQSTPSIKAQRLASGTGGEALDSPPFSAQ